MCARIAKDIVTDSRSKKHHQQQQQQRRRPTNNITAVATVDNRVLCYVAIPAAAAYIYRFLHVRLGRNDVRRDNKQVFMVILITQVCRIFVTVTFAYEMP